MLYSSRILKAIGISGCIIILFTLLSMNNPEPLHGEDVSGIVDRLQKLYNSIDDMEAEFVQRSRIPNRAEEVEAKGMVFFKKPAKMRWDYQVPDRQEIVSDGKTLWVYQPRLKQVMVSELSKMGGQVTSNFLSGMGKLSEDFTITISGSDKEYYTLNLNPRTRQPDFDKLFLKVRKKDMMVVETRFSDIMGGETIVEFSKISTNKGISSDIFHFRMPEGVKVVRP